MANDNFIVNLSLHTFISDQKSVLELGLNFSLSWPPSIPKLIASIENSFKFGKFSSAQKEYLRVIFVTLKNRIYAQNNLTSTQKGALSDIKSNNDLIISKADINGHIILLDKMPFLS